MLEIFFLIRFCRHLSKLAKGKGRSGSWGGLGALFWFAGEILGFVVGAATSDELGAGAYVVALIFAAVGAMVAYFIVKSLKSESAPVPEMVPMAAGNVALPIQPVDTSNPYAPPRAQ